MRVVPRANEEINETWIADRDRFSYEGLYAADRATGTDGEGAAARWREVDWETALEAAADGVCRGDRDARRRPGRRSWRRRSPRSRSWR